MTIVCSGLPDAGLSPRVRGNLLVHEQHGFARGSIPACAGEPVAVRQIAGGMEVYPRVCGGTISTKPSSKVK